MNEPTKDMDQTEENEVAIAARTTLDAAREAEDALDDETTDEEANAEEADVPGVDEKKELDHVVVDTSDMASAQEASNEGDDKVLLVMGALEKLASATDQMAHQLGERLEDIRSGFADELQSTRTDIAETHRADLDRLLEAAEQTRDAIENRPESSGGEFDDSGLRQSFAEGLDSMIEQNERHVSGQVGKVLERLDQRFESIESQMREEAKSGRDRMNEALEALQQQVRDHFAQNEKAQRETMERLENAQEENLKRMGDQLREVQESVISRSDDIENQFGEARDTLQSELKDLRDQMDGISRGIENLFEVVRDRTDAVNSRVGDAEKEIKDELFAVRDGVGQTLMESEARLRESSREDSSNLKEAVERGRNELVRGQRSVVADLAEGLGLAQTSMEKRFDSVESSLTAWRDDSKRRLETWAQEQNDRMSAVEEETREVGELGRKLERNHTEMMEMFDREKQRADDLEQDRLRDQARRVNNSGVARYHSGEFEHARRLFEQAVELDKTFAEAFNNLGLSLTELDEHDEATVAFEAAIELNPDLGASYNNLGYVLYLQENFEAAIEMYKEAIGHEHDTSAAYTNLGNAYQKLGESEKAVDAWRQAIEVDPSNERALQYLERFAGGAGLAGASKDDAE